MSLLAAKNYDPATAVTVSLSTLTAMTALDTTNLRLNFTAPVSGNVLVRMKCGLYVTSYPVPALLFGVMEGATIKARGIPMGLFTNYSSGASYWGLEWTVAITGLTAGAPLTWDAAMAVKYSGSSATLRYGGPSDTNIASAFGAFQFEVWTA
jgi:hypothetical protein